MPKRGTKAAHSPKLDLSLIHISVLQKAGFVYDHDVIDHKFDGTAVPCRAYHLVKEDL